MKQAVKILSFLFVGVLFFHMNTISYAGIMDNRISTDEVKIDYYESIYDFTSTSDWLVMGTFDTSSGGTQGDYDSVTGTWQNIVSTEPIYLPYGSAFVLDYDTVAYSNLDFRLYTCDEDGRNITYFDYSDLAPDHSDYGTDNDYTTTNFVVTEEDGIWIYIRILPWSSTWTQEDVESFKSAIKVYDLTAINAPVFDNSTIKQCWDNTANYEAWPSQAVCYNSGNGLYYIAYATQSAHAVYDGEIVTRTSDDLVNWSDPVTAELDYSKRYCVNSLTYLSSGDLLLHAKVNPNTVGVYSVFFRSSDNGQTWTEEPFILDGEDVTGALACSRISILDNGMLINKYTKENKNYSICFSTDNGKTWMSSEFESSKLTIADEFNFVMLRNGNILCAERSVEGIHFLISTDNGKTFTGEKKIEKYYNIGISKTPAQIIYDKSTDSVSVYWIDRYQTGGLICMYSTGEKMTDWLLNGADFSGLTVKCASLGANGNQDQGYPHIITMADGTVKCFYYSPAVDGKNTASFFSITGIIKDFEHSHLYTYYTVPPTCTEKGYTTYTCTICGDSYVDNYVNATGHTYDSGKVTKAATCAEAGIKTYTCTVCGATKTETIAKTSHSYEAVLVKAGKKADGYTADQCSVCGDIKNKKNIYHVQVSSYKMSWNSKTYTGKTIATPTITLTDYKGNTISSSNYTVKIVDLATGKTVSKIKNVGKYSIQCVLKGNYTGTLKKTVVVKPKMASLSSVGSTAAKSITTKWKTASGVDGYQIQYSTSSKFTDSTTKTVTVKGQSKKSKTVKSNVFKSGTKYYVRIRTYKKVQVNGHSCNIYSSYSDVKTVTVKK